MRSFSVIIPWRNRPELAETLAANTRFFARHASEIVIVNCGGDVELLQQVIARQQLTSIRHVFLPGATYNKCMAANVGVRHSRGRLLFFIDADITLQSDIFRRASSLLDRAPTLVMVRSVVETQPDASSVPACVKSIVNTRVINFTDGRRARLIATTGSDGSRSGPGLLLLEKAHFLRVGGFNSTIKGWGFDDVDFVIRLQRELNLTLRAIGRVLHRTHGDDVRDIQHGSRDRDNDYNRLLCFGNYERGAFLGSYEEDTRAWQDRVHEVPPPRPSQSRPLTPAV